MAAWHLSFPLKVSSLTSSRPQLTFFPLLGNKQLASHYAQHINISSSRRVEKCIVQIMTTEEQFMRANEDIYIGKKRRVQDCSKCTPAIACSGEGKIQSACQSTSS